MRNNYIIAMSLSHGPLTTYLMTFMSLPKETNSNEFIVCNNNFCQRLSKSLTIFHRLSHENIVPDYHDWGTFFKMLKRCSF